MLENSDVFTDELIVDELRDFFGAAVQTTQYASQTMISHLTQSPQSLKKMRDEYAKVTAKQGQVGDNLLKHLKENMTLETSANLEFLNWVVCETLRFQGPASNTSFYEFTQDTKIGHLKVRKGDEFTVILNGLHYNGE